MKTFIALLKGVCFFLNCLWIIPVQTLILLFHKGPFSFVFVQIWHKFTCAFMQIKVEVKGKPVRDRQTLYMSNHLSYMDIAVLGSCIPNAAFVSKAEVADWPVFGFLGTLQQTVFIRRKRSEAGKQKNALQERIDQGGNLIIFPEGTSTDGREVWPFKSSLFSLAMGVEGLCVQPVTIEIITADGKKPTDQDIRDLYAWHINMTTPFFEHIKRLAKTRGAHIRVTFHEPLNPNDFENRKDLAHACWNAVQKELNA